MMIFMPLPRKHGRSFSPVDTGCEAQTFFQEKSLQIRLPHFRGKGISVCFQQEM
jgi:hypothetical protein